ncbi:Zn-dependent exopeptidase [Ceraceosorus guamensis]|uniref:Zn-dependent exopeptidase n=1 Tax=Ceraceosorus guamensis TaxID=1522189 RepID=A0A316VV82_9BASI|nr:Zn-dependent exopeptidase [Ceraceosorus guamensis]PWN41537.1 Zn-dependent exopeptidase [Ceraceosorus guamensis]
MYLEQPKAESAKEALKRYTKVTHVAGTDADKESAVGLVSEWGSLLGAEVPDDPTKLVFDAGSHDAIRYMTSTGRSPRVWVDTYSSWLNYPVSSSLKLRKADSQEAYWQAKLKEDVVDELPELNWDVPVFHGYSKSGIANGPIVYAALCTKKDFEDLARKGVKVEGAITLCRYGGPFRGLKVRASADNGAVGTLIYSDPAEDNGVTEANGHKPYPDGPARQPSSVQRGSVQALSIAPGDPSTIGFPSYRNASRESPETADSLPTIPSLPISFEDAKALLLAVQGKGVKAAEVGDNWVGQVPGVEEYWTGPSEDIASLDNQMTDIGQVHDIWNTYAYIPGQIQDEIVMIGNHRDAWTYGAADPSSGTAALHEVVKGLGALRAKGWAPLRSIIVASWDAEEYGLVGSTEATEDYAQFYQQRVVAYLNSDVAVSGPGLFTGASPSLSDLLIKAGAAITDPDGDGKETLKIEHPGALGSGSDYTGFLQHLGIASTDLGFRGGIGAAATSDFASPEKAVDRKAKYAGPVYHYHSRFDSFPWMEKFGDPTFKHFEAAAKLLGLSLLRLTSELEIPLNITAYANELDRYYDKVNDKLETARSDRALDIAETEEKDLAKTLRGLEKTIKSVQANARGLDERRAHLSKEIKHLLANLPAAQVEQSTSNSRRPGDDFRKLFHLLQALQVSNKRATYFERGFISREGLKGRPWYRHLVVAPGRWLGYGATTFPGITEAITLDKGQGAVAEVKRLDQLLGAIAKRLQVRRTHRKAH